MFFIVREYLIYPIVAYSNSFNLDNKYETLRKSLTINIAYSILSALSTICQPPLFVCEPLISFSL